MINRLIIIFLMFFLLSPTLVLAGDKDSGFDRVIASNTIRCGYTLWNPILLKDTNDDSYSGVAVDIMNEVGKRTGLKIEWVEEVSVDVILQGLQSNRYDMVCFPLYILGTRARAAFFSEPLYFSPIYLAVKESDQRFDNNLDIIDNPKIKLAVLEGEATALLGPRRFPKATIHAVPQVQGYGFVLKDVAIGKADVTISDKTSIADFNKNNPDKLRTLDNPFAVNAVAFHLAQDEKLRNLINAVILEIKFDGWLENLLKTKYPEYYQEIIMPSPSYDLRK